MWDRDLGGHQLRFTTCPEYLSVFNLNLIISTKAPLHVSSFAEFHLGAREQAWRADFARLFLLRKEL